ncbi:hypothetical protein CONLIGDRAFT_636808 [Coniochaeta ligniaria NRRL 30616]|uniref:Uncharacterized protein n=1 Tax=Coniochaeta ligniaria NRRL 30616 TaxID=1408157 RepID=A0A1J7IBJ6_9PEZI|nr:hypothetical protein CONLIGDRAFT_636808 [Coniochaeta ligniaria NRRL 30616]
MSYSPWQVRISGGADFTPRFLFLPVHPALMGPAFGFTKVALAPPGFGLVTSFVIFVSL